MGQVDRGIKERVNRIDGEMKEWLEIKKNSKLVGS